MAVELGTAYISILPSTSKLAPEISKALGKVPVAKSGGQIGDGLLAGIGKSLKFGAIAVGTTAIAGLGAALVKGFSRLDSLDQATAKLTGLGHSAQTVDEIMGNALASVKGTAFGMDEAATTAATAVAAGIKPGKELEKYLKLTADAASIAGSSLGDMGSVMNNVTTVGAAYNDSLQILAQKGIPIYTWLSESMGISTESVKNLASQGKISSETFRKAIEDNVGGAALEAGNTFSGAMDNLFASLGRIGAGILGGIFPQLKDGLGGLTEVLAPVEAKAKEVGAAFGAWVSDVGPKVIPVLAGIGDAIGGVFSWIGENLDLIKNLAIAFGVLAAAVLVYRGVVALLALPMQIATAAQIAWNIAMSLNPIGLIVLAIIALVAAIIWVATQTTFFQDAWAAVSGWFMAVWASISQFFIDTWNNIAAFFGVVWQVIVFIVMTYINTVRTIIETVVNFIVAVWTNVWNGISSFFSTIWGGIVAFVTFYINTVKTIISTVINTIRNVWNTIWSGISTFFGNIWKGILKTINTVGTVFGNVFNTVAGVVKGAFEGVVSVVKGVINGIIDAVNGVIGGINGVAGAIGGVLGVDIQIGKIPRLAKGGIVSHGGGGIIANVGEGKYDEAVVPLNQKFYDSLSAGSSSSGGGTYTQNNTFEQTDPTLQARQAGREFQRLLAS